MSGKILGKTQTYKRFRSWPIVLTIVLLIGLMLTLIVRAELENKDDIHDQINLLTVNTAKLVAKPSYISRRSFTGQVEAAQTSAVGFELAGKVNDVEVDEGDVINEGKKLAQLDSARLLAKRRELASRLKEIETQAKLAELTLGRLNKALEYGGVTQQQLDEGQQRLDSARTNMEVVRASINSIDTDIEKSTLRAPYDAIVIKRHVDIGQVVASGLPVLTLQKNTETEARVGITSSALQGLSIGDMVDIELEGKPNQARIRSILPLRNNVTRVVDIILELDELTARPGDLVKLIIRRDIDEAGYWIPISALEEGERGLWTVFLTEPDKASSAHTLRRHFVNIIHQESERVFIKEFDHQDQQYVIDGLQRVVAGQRVNINSQQMNFVVGVRP